MGSRSVHDLVGPPGRARGSRSEFPGWPGGPPTAESRPIGAANPRWSAISRDGEDRIMKRQFVAGVMGLAVAGCAHFRSEAPKGPPSANPASPVGMQPVPSIYDTINRGTGNPAMAQSALGNPNDPRWSGQAPRRTRIGRARRRPRCRRRPRNPPRWRQRTPQPPLPLHNGPALSLSRRRRLSRVSGISPARRPSRVWRPSLSRRPSRVSGIRPVRRPSRADASTKRSTCRPATWPPPRPPRHCRPARRRWPAIRRRARPVARSRDCIAGVHGPRYGIRPRPRPTPAAPRQSRRSRRRSNGRADRYPRCWPGRAACPAPQPAHCRQVPPIVEAPRGHCPVVRRTPRRTVPTAAGPAINGLPPVGEPPASIAGTATAPTDPAVNPSGGQTGQAPAVGATRPQPVGDPLLGPDPDLMPALPPLPDAQPAASSTTAKPSAPAGPAGTTPATGAAPATDLPSTGPAAGAAERASPADARRRRRCSPCRAGRLAAARTRTSVGG